MSNYDSTRVPSEFLANLNAIPSAADLAATEDFNFDADLAMFTNTTFFDFDLGQDLDVTQPNPQRFEQNQGFEGQQQQHVEQQTQQQQDDLAKANMDFLSGELGFSSVVFRFGVFAALRVNHPQLLVIRQLLSRRESRCGPVAAAIETTACVFRQAPSALSMGHQPFDSSSDERGGNNLQICRVDRVLTLPILQPAKST